MPKINWSKVALGIPRIIDFAMHVAEKLKGAKSGPEKEAAVVEGLIEGVDLGENLTGKDFVDNPELVEAAKAYMAARVNLMNLVDHIRSLKPAAPPTDTD